ncbi:MAG: hypothetical protein OXE99_07860 [Cellvibrionales bacterium]|nr:hypothetical protein [Cellvibrionales bacterium]
MKAIFFMIIALGLMFSTQSFASSTGLIQNATITTLRFYDKEAGKIHGLIILNNNRLAGTNPEQTSQNCQFWTNSEIVFESARLALRENYPVDVTYTARGDEAKSCQVDNIVIRKP